MGRTKKLVVVMYKAQRQIGIIHTHRAFEKCIYKRLFRGMIMGKSWEDCSQHSGGWDSEFTFILHIEEDTCGYQRLITIY